MCPNAWASGGHGCPSQDSTIFLVLEQGFEVRYILGTDIFTILKKSGARIVILIPNLEEGYISDEYCDTNVVVDKLDIDAYDQYYANSSLQRQFAYIATKALPQGDDFVHINEKGESTLPASRRGQLLTFLTDLAIAILRRSSRFRQLFQTVESSLFAGSHIHGKLFDRYSPNMVVTATPGHFTYDTYMLREARKRRIRAVSVVSGWDKAVSRGLLRAPLDGVVIWGAPQREEMIRYQGFTAGKIFMSGPAIFDIYHTKDRLYSKEAVFQRYGVNPGCSLLLFGGKSPTSYYNEGALAALAATVLEQGFACKIVARVHPLYFKPSFQGGRSAEEVLSGYRKIQAQFPGLVELSVPRIRSNILRFDLHPEEMLEVGSLIWHADVLVNLFSTLMIEACMLDTPVINIAFDPTDCDDGREYRPIRVDMQQPHNARGIRSGALRLAHTPQQLGEEIARYIADPQFERNERSNYVLSECGYFDGKCGRRAGEYLLEMLGKSNSG